MPANEEAMTVAREWMAKGDNDLKSSAYLLKIKDCPTDAVCFHAQQCVEKYLKALLVALGTGFRKIHDLGELVALLLSRHHFLLDEKEQDRLTEYATVTRYPGDYEPISVGEARQAVKVASSPTGSPQDLGRETTVLNLAVVIIQKIRGYGRGIHQ